MNRQHRLNKLSNRLRRCERRKIELFREIETECVAAKQQGRKEKNGDLLSAQINRLNTRIKELREFRTHTRSNGIDDRLVESGTEVPTVKLTSPSTDVHVKQ